MKSKLEIKETVRGFRRADFIDTYQQECSIQESSNIDTRLWLGVQTSTLCRDVKTVDGKTVDLPRMHLSQEQVADLIPLLKHFVKTGRLPRR